MRQHVKLLRERILSLNNEECNSKEVFPSPVSGILQGKHYLLLRILGIVPYKWF